MKLYCYLSLLLVAVVLVACGPSTSIPPQKTTVPTPSPTRKITRTPTKEGEFPVCNEKVTNTPCVEYASAQDAAEGESYTGDKVHISFSKGVVTVMADITNANEPIVPSGSHTSLEAIQLQCFHFHVGLWWGLRSTIDPGGGQTNRKSPFSEVDVYFTDQHIGTKAFAACILSSPTVDRIDKLGMWDDGDYTGIWPLYDRKFYRP